MARRLRGGDVRRATPSHSRRPQCLVSAAANAKNNYDMKKSNLVISTAYADMGPKMKRFRCGDRGKPRPYSKLTSHITIKVSERPAEALN